MQRHRGERGANEQAGLEAGTRTDHGGRAVRPVDGLEHVLDLKIGRGERGDPRNSRGRGAEIERRRRAPPLACAQLGRPELTQRGHRLGRREVGIRGDDGTGRSPQAKVDPWAGRRHQVQVVNEHEVEERYVAVGCAPECARAFLPDAGQGS